MVPFSDVDGYTPGHFARVYRDIIRPACEKAGFRARRVDDEAETGMIHLDIIRSIVNAPMAICDLTAHRGNVLFELGMRQAFDKPVVLIQDERTGRLFDISGLRTTSYHSSLIYADVIADQSAIANALRKTDERTKSGETMNSIVSLLSISKADLKNVDKVDAGELIRLMRDEMELLRREVRDISAARGPPSPRGLGLATSPYFFGVRSGKGDVARIDSFVYEMSKEHPKTTIELIGTWDDLWVFRSHRGVYSKEVRRIANSLGLEYVSEPRLPPAVLDRLRGKP